MEVVTVFLDGLGVIEKILNGCRRSLFPGTGRVIVFNPVFLFVCGAFILYFVLDQLGDDQGVRHSWIESA
jgi:hypothetical protein